ncbi:MAG: InlB B-repeat-containing protein [Lachnospiraceae bacterium]|nr:InlB B-repeat-containing protein [Lachnospiraceae bacterium]
MKKSGRRILSIILTAVMIFALLPVFGKPIVVKADDVQEHDHSNWDEISTSKQLMELGENGGSGYLVNNIEISEPFIIYSGKTVNLCLNGFSITQTEDVNTITVKGTLNLYDKKDNLGKITHANGKNCRGVFNYGTFTMNGGTISGNNSSLGAGVNNAGTFTMNGGTISGNNAMYGGGVLNTETFKMEGGTIKDNTASKKGSGVCSTQTFVKEGGEIDGSIEYSASTLFTVTFNANDGSNNTITQYVRPDVDTNLYPNKFRNKGKKFDCWKTESGQKTYDDKESIKISENLILNAQWVECATISSVVTFKINNGSWSDGSTVKEVEYWRNEDEDLALNLKAEDIPTPENPDTGYKLGSWDAEPDTGKTLEKDETYTYTFAPIEYTIKYDSNGGTGTMNNQSRKYDDKTALTANAFTYEGKTFDCWNTVADGSGTPYKDEEISNLSSTDNDTVTLYAQWTIGTFTISWKNYDGTVLETDKNVAYGSTPSYDGETPVRAKEGNKKYTFSGWTPEIDTVKGAATYTATYSEEEIVEQTEPETPQNPTEPETPEEPEEEIPEKDWLDDLRLALNIAAEPDSEKTVEYSGDFALPYEIMNFLVNHPDITFVYHVTYEGQEYTITIPAGKAVAYADTPWYGPLWLLANYGGNNAPTGAKGNGTYVVKAGDTLTGISVKLGVTIQYLVDKNGIKNPDYIVEGQELIY